jgi:hypothetical protein
MLLRALNLRIEAVVAVPIDRTTIPPLLGERAGVRASFLQPRHEALIKRFRVRGRTSQLNLP